MRRRRTEEVHAEAGGPAAARPPWGRRIAAAVLGLVVLTGVAATGVAWQWGERLAEEQRLLPGTTIAAVDVGEWTVDEARAMARQVGAEALARSVTVRAGDEKWAVTAAALGATTDADAVVDAAYAATTAVSLPDLLRTRWLDEDLGFAADVTVTVDEQAVADYVAGLAEDFDLAAEDAAITWTAEGLRSSADADGRRLQQAAAVAALHGTLEGNAADVELPVEVLPPAVTDAMIAAVEPALAVAVDAALDRPVALVHEDREWTVTARELHAWVDPQPVVEAALGPGVTAASTAATDLELDPADVPFALPEQAVEDFVAGVAGEVDVAARDAAIDSSTGWVRIVPERAGRAVDREETRVAVEAALKDRQDDVELPVTTVAPQVTTAAYRTVLLVRQGDRRLHLYRDGEITRSWDVAIGALGHDTPKGRFTVGAKRHMPTWHNPSPNGWGADMPAVIGPGPDNPLGVRALNWMRNGRDTLIRFHGTANLGSIGQAASKGCVRMRNSDIVELYDLVPTGTPIVSL
jgi:lipoprotein-anchoring transpeptidase ErfK/SrfK